jgi:hypothetical protein
MGEVIPRSALVGVNTLVGIWDAASLRGRRTVPCDHDAMTATTSVTRAAGAFLVPALVLVLGLGAAGCTGGDDDDKGDAGSGRGSEAADAPAVVTATTLKNLGKDVPDAKRERLKEGIEAAVDPWFDGAFLGDFPRTDYTAAFASFTPGAARDAEQRDLDLLTNDAIGDQIDAATATARRVRVELFMHDGRARGGTAYVTLDFDTTGTLAESRRVNGRLYLVKQKGAWQVFGYDVDEAETR